MVISIAWLGIIVDIMVGAFEQIGETVNMSEATMGLVFSAIGTSFPCSFVIEEAVQTAS